MAVSPRLVRASRREAVDRTPVWFMRQAGRYLPEYRAVRERHSLLDICADAELTARVTFQPLERFDLDAAIIFADILLPLVPMGVDLEFVADVGPAIHDPIRSRADVEALRPVEPAASLASTLDAIRAVREELPPDVAVIGFAGAPFTLTSYLIEGGPSRSYGRTKALMAREPETFASLMEVLATSSSSWLLAQIGAGADVVQLFDSWVGCLDAGTYERQVAPHSARVLAAVAGTGAPSIHFAVAASHLLAAIASLGADAVGVDWRVPLDESWAVLGESRAIQGNLDPTALLGPTEHLRKATRDVMARAGGRVGHLFNLGHGVLPETPPDAIGTVVDTVRAFEDERP